MHKSGTQALDFLLWAVGPAPDVSLSTPACLQQVCAKLGALVDAQKLRGARVALGVYRLGHTKEKSGSSRLGKRRRDDVKIRSGMLLYEARWCLTRTRIQGDLGNGFALTTHNHYSKLGGRGGRQETEEVEHEVALVEALTTTECSRRGRGADCLSDAKEQKKRYTGMNSYYWRHAYGSQI